MAENEKSECESITLNTSIVKKVSVKSYKRTARNSRRRIRRKKSKFRYYAALKNCRSNKRTSELCAAINVVDIHDMDWAPTSTSPALPIEVTEWQKHDQIAYWKSRAISLEYENKMLKQHLRNVYARTIEDYSQQYETTPISDDNPKSRQTPVKSNMKKVAEVVSPNLPESKKRAQEMEQIYGDMAPKIMGMETALQLDYERHLEQSKPPYWPTVALNMKFNN